MRLKKLLNLTICLICLGLFAQVGMAEKKIQAVRADHPPRIDGFLDEEVWRKAVRIEDFIQSEPLRGDQPSERTVAYVMYDDKYLYIGFECFMRDMEKIQANTTRHDGEFWNDDYVEVMLDTFHDRRNAYIFSVNPLSTKSEWRYSPEERRHFGGGKSWDCEWYARARKLEDRWTAEIAVPFHELRFKKGPQETWGINFLRNIESLDEEDTWAYPGERDNDPSYYGELVGLPTERLVASRPMEFKPYLTSSGNVEEGSVDADMGIDMRIPLPSITVDLTVNPDYAQIEADPERINLSDIPIRFPEKRPFFMEGEELFRTPLDIFYTRRILQPRIGAKAVGKIGGYSFALFDTQTEKVENEEGKEIEPPANFMVVRLQGDVGRRSTIGMLAVNKQHSKGANRVGGVDFSLRFPFELNLSGQIAASQTDREGKNTSDLAFMLKGSWERDPIFILSGLQQMGEDFSAEAGFLPDIFIGRRRFNLDARIHKRFKSRFIRRLGFGPSYSYGSTLDGVRTNEQWEFGMMVGIWDFFIRTGFTSEFRTDPKDISIGYNDRSVDGFMGWFPPRWVGFRMMYKFGTRDEKKMLFLSPELSLKPIETASIRVEGQWLRMKGEDDQRILRSVFEYSFTRDMNLRITAEGRLNGHRSLFALYSWEFKPESNLFLVYTYNEEEGKREQVGYFKVAYRMRWQPRM
jgi:hypothetical protein